MTVLLSGSTIRSAVKPNITLWCNQNLTCFKCFDSVRFDPRQNSTKGSINSTYYKPLQVRGLMHVGLLTRMSVREIDLVARNERPGYATASAD